MALWVRLARRFAAASYTRRSAGAVGVIAIASMALAITLGAFDQTGQQVVQQELGRFEYRADLAGLVTAKPGEDGDLKAVVAAAAGNGATRAVVMLSTFDVRPTTRARTFTTYLEAPWVSEPFPSRYKLLSGRWPRIPTEVAVTNSYASAAPDMSASGSTGTTSVLSGNVHFNVVGRVLDRFGTKSSKILAAPGTWQALNSPALREKYPSLSVSPSLLWSGGDPRQVAAAVKAAIPSTGVEDLGPGGAPEPLGFTSRANELARRKPSYLGAIPLGYQVPSLVLPIAAALSAFGVNGRRLRRNLGILRSVGVRSRDASMAVMLASSFWLLAASFLGSVLGIVVGIAARTVSAHFATRPLAPLSGLLAPAERTVGIVSLCCLAVIITTLSSQRRAAARVVLQPLLAVRAAAGPIRKSFTLAAGVVLVLQCLRLRTVSGAMLLVVTVAAFVVLLIPEILPRLLRRLPAEGPRQRLARQQLLTDGTRSQTAAALTTVTLGLSITMVILLQALTASEAQSHISLTAPMQVDLVSGGGGLASPPSRDLVDQVQASLPARQKPIDVGYLYGNGAVAHLQNTTSGIILVVDSVDDATRLSNKTLDAEGQKALEQGHLLLWEGSTAALQPLVVTDANGVQVKQTPPVPTLRRAFPASWQAKAAGIMLRSTATSLALPTSHAELVFTGVDSTEARRAQQSALDAGYDIAQVGIYSPPPPVVAPLAFWSSALGLAALLLVAIASVARAQAVTLRPYLSGLIALGLSTSWARSILYLEICVLAVISVVLGAAISVPPLLVARAQIRGFVVSIPWLEVSLLLALFALSGIAATWRASRQIKAIGRRTA